MKIALVTDTGLPDEILAAIIAGDTKLKNLSNVAPDGRRMKVFHKFRLPVQGVDELMRPHGYPRKELNAVLTHVASVCFRLGKRTVMKEHREIEQAIRRKRKVK